jgi:hypothetical protein
MRHPPLDRGSHDPTHTDQATINRALAALRAGARLGLDNDTIVAMPRVRLLPEKNARQGFAEAKQITAICRRLPPDLTDTVARDGIEPPTPGFSVLCRGFSAGIGGY